MLDAGSRLEAWRAAGAESHAPRARWARDAEPALKFQPGGIRNEPVANSPGAGPRRDLGHRDVAIGRGGGAGLRVVRLRRRRGPRRPRRHRPEPDRELRDVLPAGSRDRGPRPRLREPDGEPPERGREPALRSEPRRTGVRHGGPRSRRPHRAGSPDLLQRTLHLRRHGEPGPLCLREPRRRRQRRRTRLRRTGRRLPGHQGFPRTRRRPRGSCPPATTTPSWTVRRSG